MDPDRFVHYILGIKEIDDEHLNIIQMFVEISTLRDSDCILYKLEMFLKLIKEHFKNEEKLMEDHNFPYILHHKNEHKHIEFKIEKLIKNNKAKNKVELKYFINVLEDSLLRHIDQQDRQITEYLNNLVEK